MRSYKLQQSTRNWNKQERQQAKTSTATTPRITCYNSDTLWTNLDSRAGYIVYHGACYVTGVTRRTADQSPPSQTELPEVSITYSALVTCLVTKVIETKIKIGTPFWELRAMQTFGDRGCKTVFNPLNCH